MSFTDFLKRQLMNFFIISTCIAATMALLGNAFMPQTRLDYLALLAPLAYGLLCTLPSLLLYAPRDLSSGQLLARKAAHRLLIIAAVCGVMAANGLRDPLVFALLALSVLAISAIVEAVNWLQSSREARQLNQQLQAMRLTAED